jgi:hypothetical protein
LLARQLFVWGCPWGAARAGDRVSVVVSTVDPDRVGERSHHFYRPGALRLSLGAIELGAVQLQLPERVHVCKDLSDRLHVDYVYGKPRVRRVGVRL